MKVFIVNTTEDGEKQMKALFTDHDDAVNYGVNVVKQHFTIQEGTLIYEINPRAPIVKLGT